VVKVDGVDVVSHKEDYSRIYVNDVLVVSISFIFFRAVLEERKINKQICNACKMEAAHKERRKNISMG
jgi:hypothetical protein